MRMKRLSCLIIVFIIIIGLFSSVIVNAISIDDQQVILKQPASGDGTCYFTSCLNMFRRRAIIDGISDWQSITHDNYRYVITSNGTWVKATITNVKGMNAGWVGLSSISNKKNTLLNYLSSHPEGIVIHSEQGVEHAVLLTSYDSYTDTFYCIDTLYSRPNEGVVKLSSSWMGSDGASQDQIVNRLDSLMYITNKSGGSSTPSPTPVDFGTDFYTFIFHHPSWKPIECDPNGTNVYLSSEKWTANQLWYAKRNEDGSYTFKNAANNKCLDVEYGIDVNMTNIHVYDENGSDAQKWYIYYVDGQYVFQPKISTDKVMDLSNAGTTDGTNVQIYQYSSGNKAQAFSLYITECSAEKPTIEKSADFILEDTPITISWDKTNFTDHYIYYLAEYPTAYAYTTYTKTGVTKDNYITFTDLKAGNYTIFVHAVSHNGYWGEQSNWVSFIVNSKDYVPIKTVVTDDRLYSIYDYEMSWSMARDLCKNMGGHLVTITSAEENKIVEELISSGSKDAYWLGATDVDKNEKEYEWITGESFSYSNWLTNEPSSSGTLGEKEHFVEVRKSYGYKWNDVNNINKSNKGFVLEIELDDIVPTAEQRYKGSKYLLFDHNMTWTEAKEYCENIGGHLATINSVEEYEFLSGFLGNGERKWYFLGAKKKNGVFKWIDTNENVPISGNNSHWLDGTPTVDAYSNYMMMYRNSKKWYELKNYYEYSDHMKHLGFVCEIPVADIDVKVSHNNNKFTVDSYVYNISYSGIFIVSGYNSDNKLENIQIIPYENQEFITSSLVGDIDKIKVMIWDSLQSGKPLCEAEIIEKSEFVEG